jgi:DNA polymerase elongation subunit (family B)
LTKFFTQVYQDRGRFRYCGYENGEKVHRLVKYEPYLFVDSQQTKTAGYRTIRGNKVEKRSFDSIGDARAFVANYGQVSGFSIYGSDRFMYNFINDEFAGRIQYDYDLIRIGFIDIEVGSDETTGFPQPELAEQEVTAICLEYRGTYYAFGCGDYENDNENVVYTKCVSEQQLLRLFLELWQKLDLDVISGWYVQGFDIPYLYNRCVKLFGEEFANRLSPWGKVDIHEFTAFGRTVKEYQIAGINTLDYMELYKKHSYTPQENYRLETVAQHELGYGKVEYKGSLLGLWKTDYKKFIDYNIRDVELVVKLDEKMKFIELVAALAYDAKVNYQDTFTTVKIWDVIIHNYLLDQFIVVPFSSRGGHDRAIIGGYVKDTIPGLYRWVVSFDFASLYPSLIQQYNISPDTFVDRLDDISPDTILRNQHQWALEDSKQRDLTLCSIGTRFRRDRTGFLSELMARKYADRAAYKKEMIAWERKLETVEGQIKAEGETLALLAEKKLCENNVAKFRNFQQVVKIQLNSAFGALANPGFRYFASDLAESITASGQMTTQFAERKLNEYLNKACNTSGIDYVIAADTDSNYVSFDTVVKKFCKPGMSEQEITRWLDRLVQEAIQPYLEKCFSELCGLVNAHRDGVIVMKRENIGDVSIFIAKKRYIMNVYNKEGVTYDEPKLKVVGIEAVRSSTPVMVKDYIKEALKLVVKGKQTELHQYIAECRAEFTGGIFGDVAKPSSVKGLKEYGTRDGLYTKGTPIHVRGSLLYNSLLASNDLSNKYPVIQDGDKIKFAYLRMPNPIRENVIACPNDELPPEFELQKYIDYDTQFSKTFIDPIENIIGIIGWSSEEKGSLEAFFG